MGRCHVGKQQSRVGRCSGKRRVNSKQIRGPGLREIMIGSKVDHTKYNVAEVY
ncbi:uncharacterized protein G2W53_023403 [Senna tora]|uniref:Uncharacterized protein n=1 Tax=Senna tora TaxID=362788 RepID=A0A834T9H6_9FABA|nr:uncharacterized protein G2W53_023403 [Senna tora]